MTVVLILHLCPEISSVVFLTVFSPNFLCVSTSSLDYLGCSTLRSSSSRIRKVPLTLRCGLLFSKGSMFFPFKFPSCIMLVSLYLTQNIFKVVVSEIPSLCQSLPFSFSVSIF